MRKRVKERVFYKNKKGKIIEIEDILFGGSKYILLDADGNYVRRIYPPFCVKDIKELF